MTAPVRRKTARKGRRSQRDLDREAISWGVEWEVRPDLRANVSWAGVGSQHFATQSMAQEVSRAAARELNRIAKEARRGTR